ncbi:hypothetical protein D0Z07_6306 [Hyphodiscus hymeniophilus]|uniref:Uncharacterized protein n=1 Tax=Hyphodiscus hymeniophilus TaxID=353542 RepID=A0A9P6VFJ8_9HELO|nr:hypothetical protein D0Z07_6306 [Hyphodiscus hymeniophilus]
MPFGIHKHSNRSKQALVDSTTAAAQGAASQNEASSASLVSSPIAASGTVDEARTDQIQSFNQQPRTDQHDFNESPTPEVEQRTYQRGSDLPSRSQSTRHPSASYPQSPAQVLNSSADDLSIDARRLQPPGRQNPAQSQSPVTEHKKSKSIFDRMRSSRAPEQKPSATPTQASYNNTTGLARRLSKRQENPPSIRTGQQRNSLDQQQRLDWQSAQDIRSHLPSPQEGHEDDSELDPYLIRESDDSNPQDTVQGLGLQQTIRPVQDDSEPLQVYEPNEDERYYSPRLSYESAVEQREEQRPNSVQSNGPSPTSAYPQQREGYPARTTSIQPQGPRPPSQQAAMAPPTGASQQSRRSADPKQTLQNAQGQGESRDGPPPSYSQQFPRGQPPTPGASPLPPPVGQQGPNYRGGPPQRDQYGATGGGEQGRSTPPPAPGERDVNDAYKELLQKYKKVKGLYFDKTSQVEQLQNTLANQRLSQSRTSLDDSEYMTRFQRLDGATTNLAFNIRKDWRLVPSWLSQYVNQDALKIGKQEMTGVGRACITRFLVDEIFSKTFHPGLETELSMSLKGIEQNIRRFSPALNNQEESDALTAKVVQWRLATLEGLRDVLSAPESEEHKKQFARLATTNLTANLLNYLAEPAPPGIEDSAHMIVELAVSIASNLPLESRDISIVYPMPGDLLQPFIMKVEAGIPPLENPGAETSSEVDASSTASGDKDETASKEAEKAEAKAARKEKTKSGMLQAMMGGSSTSTAAKKAPVAETSSDGKSKASTDDGAQKVRFAGFVGVEVRGRQMLSKAPVWAIGS